MIYTRFLPGLVLLLSCGLASGAFAQKVDEEDGARAKRLTEEINARTYEVGVILARQLGFSVRKRGITDIRFKSSMNSELEGSVEFWVDDELVAEGCWDEETQTCYPGPCD